MNTNYCFKLKSSSVRVANNLSPCTISALSLTINSAAVKLYSAENQINNISYYMQFVVFSTVCVLWEKFCLSEQNKTNRAMKILTQFKNPSMSHYYSCCIPEARCKNFNTASIPPPWAIGIRNINCTL